MPSLDFFRRMEGKSAKENNPKIDQIQDPKGTSPIKDQAQDPGKKRKNSETATEFERSVKEPKVEITRFDLTSKTKENEWKLSDEMAKFANNQMNSFITEDEERNFRKMAITRQCYLFQRIRCKHEIPSN